MNERTEEVDIGPTVDADVALEAWARWARSALSGLGFPCINIIGKIVELGIRGAAQTTGIRLLEIDETCEIVDRAISRLDATERTVVIKTYLYNDAAQVTAKNCGLTYGYYRSVLCRARRRVRDFIEGASQKYVV